MNCTQTEHDYKCSLLHTTMKPTVYNPWTMDGKYFKQYRDRVEVTKAGRKWLIKELSKVEGGLDGIVL